MKRHSLNPEDLSSNRPLICLYKFAEMVNKYDREEASLGLTMKGLLDIIPAALRYPELTGVQILIPPIAYATEAFVSTPWGFQSDLDVFDETIGSFKVCYAREVEQDFHGPFTADEIMLFTYIANRISRIVELLRIRRQLRLERKSQRDANTALQEVLRHIQSGQTEMGRTIQSNISKVVIPLLNSITLTSSRRQQGLLHVIISNLNEITAPFSSKLSTQFSSLTPQEIVICSLIKEGMSSKEIARAKGLSFATVNNHRENIRRKLGLTNNKLNLQTFLANNFNDAAPVGTARP